MSTPMPADAFPLGTVLLIDTSALSDGLMNSVGRFCSGTPVYNLKGLGLFSQSR